MKTFKVCILAPSYKTSDGVYDSGGHNRFAGALHALKEINDKSDGMWDELVPDTTIVFEWYNSGRDDATSLQQAIKCVTTAFGGTKADLVLGAASSGPSMAANLIFSNYDIPQISYSATSPAVSNHAAYPTLFRTPPSDAYQGLAAADVIKNVFNWDTAIVIAGTDSYSAYSAKAFEDAALSGGLEVKRSVQINEFPSYDSLSASVGSIKSSATRVVFMMAQASTSGLILREAYAQGVFGADSGYVWFVTNALTSALGTAHASMTAADPCPACGGANGAPVAMTTAECDAAMKGIVGMAAMSDFGEMSSIYAGWATRFVSQADTAGTDPSTDGECQDGTTTISVSWDFQHTPGSNHLKPAHLTTPER